MKIKALFFDIDGTLVSFRTHRIPDSTVMAISEAKAKGIKIYISTGRHLSLINNIPEIEKYVDGYVTTNGALCVVGGKAISVSPISKSDVLSVYAMAKEQHFPCMFVGETEFAMINDNEESQKVFAGLLNVADFGTDTPVERVLSGNVLQITPFITDLQESAILSEVKAIDSSRWYPDFADFTAKGVNKAVGVKKIAESQGFDLSESMAFGDGGNDLAMIQAAGIGVAMGSANDSLKSVADYVTDSVDEDGIYNALRHWGII